ncbi:MAG: hypothetical protein VB031_02370 [Eubacteriaceae bacterium]|nr:hypothetical protein [Eubacteriaceae bacterium]
MSNSKTIKSIKALTGRELQMANDQFEQFHSAHEALGVTMEECIEAQSEMDRMRKITAAYVATVMINDETTLKSVSEDLKITAQRLAAEAIQVAAMAQKTIDYCDRHTEVTGKCICKVQPDQQTPPCDRCRHHCRGWKHFEEAADE